MALGISHDFRARFGAVAALAWRLVLMGCVVGLPSVVVAQESDRPPNPHVVPAPDAALLGNPVTGPMPPRPAEVDAPAVPASATRMDMVWAFVRFERGLVVGALLRECVDWMLSVTRRSASTPREGPDRP